MKCENREMCHKLTFINEKYKGYILSILSAVIFGLMPIMAKYIYSYGGNSISLVFYRTFLSLPVLYYLAIHSGSGKMMLDRYELKKVLVLVIGYVLTPILLYSSYNYISSGAATTIHFSYPIFILLGSVIIYKKNASLVEKICILLCTIGILMITNFKEINNIIGVLFAFFSGITFSAYTLYLDNSGLKEMNTYKICFYMALFASLIVFIYAILAGEFVLYMPIEGWILSFIFSILVTVFAVVFFQRGVKLIGAQKTSILSTFEPLTSIIVGVFFLNESLSMIKIIAILLILSTAILLARYGN